MISSEEHVHFTIDASGTLDDSDSESDEELPKFRLGLFNKYSNKSECFERTPAVQKGDTIKPNDFYVNVNPSIKTYQSRLAHKKKTLKESLDKAYEKSVVGKPGFETSENGPTFLSRSQSKKRSMKEREKTKGFQWYDMRVPELKEEQKNDLMVLQMRQALDPKHFYKRSVRNANPKYFEVGTYVESPVEFYSSRIPKKQRKKTIVEELMADAEFCKHQKKKTAEILKSQPKKFNFKNSKKKPNRKKKSSQ